MISTFVDVQGFKIADNKFIVKEVAILIDGNRIAHYIFKPPFDWAFLPCECKRQATWLRKNHHGLHWNDGYIEFDRLSYLLTTMLQSRIVMVKGLEKKQWLQDFVKDVHIENAEEYEDCAFRLCDGESEFKCAHHDGVCALANVFKLHRWCIDHIANNGNKN